MLAKLRDLVAPNELKLVMFDLDGTLVDSVFDLKLALDEMYRQLDMEPASLAQVRSWVGNGARVLVQRALSYSLEPKESELFEEANDHFLKHYGELNGGSSECYSGALELIALLKTGQVKVAVITNKPMKFTIPLLEAKGIQVDFVLGGDSLQEKKPSPLPLRTCIEHFRFSNKEVVMVGDSQNDIGAARSAGVKSVGVTYGYNHGVPISNANPDLIVDSLAELR